MSSGFQTYRIRTKSGHFWYVFKSISDIQLLQGILTILQGFIEIINDNRRCVSSVNIRRYSMRLCFSTNRVNVLWSQFDRSQMPLFCDVVLMTIDAVKIHLLIRFGHGITRVLI